MLEEMLIKNAHYLDAIFATRDVRHCRPRPGVVRFPLNLMHGLVAKTKMATRLGQDGLTFLKT